MLLPESLPLPLGHHHRRDERDENDGYGEGNGDEEVPKDLVGRAQMYPQVMSSIAVISTYDLRIVD